MSEQFSGHVVSVIGPVVDVEFPDQPLPAILNAVHIVDDGDKGKVPIDVTLEVAQHLGENRARCIAMEPTEETGCWSKMDFHSRPPFSDFQTPPEAVAGE